MAGIYKSTFFGSTTSTVTIAAGFKSLAILNTGLTAIIITGQGGTSISLPAGKAINWDYIDIAYDDIIINATGSSAIYSYIQ